MLREESAPGQVTHHVPQSGSTQLSPDAAQLSFRVEAPDWCQPLADIFRDDLTDGLARIAEASSVKNDIGIDGGTVVEGKTGLGERCDLGTVFDLDLSIDDLLASTDI